jgi:hypothetical protein
MIKGSEGIVLAADSRVTIMNQMQPPTNVAAPPVLIIPATFDNATKVLTAKAAKQTHVGAVTFGIGAIMTTSGPRTMQSFMPEFEKELQEKNTGRLPVKDFAEKLSEFFLRQWTTHVKNPPPGQEINFLVGGYDEGAAYGRAFSFAIPNNATPVEQSSGAGQFGITWGGQGELVYRLLQGYDAGLLPLLPQDQLANLKPEIDKKLAAGIPYQFLPLQDCIDLATFLIRSTIDFQKFRMTLRGVGGHVEVATITSDSEFQFIAERKRTG